MKKILLSVLLFSVLVLSVFAQQGVHEPGTGLQDNSDQNRNSPEKTGENPEGTQGTEPTLVMAQTRQKAENTEELKQMIQERQMELNQNMENRPEKEQNMIQNQNQVRLAVHSMLAMESLLGGIGQNISMIARGFNNSLQATIQAEEKIQNKGAFARFFTGGDEKAAEEIETQVEQNRNRIQELNQLMQDCDCDEEARDILQEQIQNMEQEQNRLSELANKEKSRKGLFGWMFK